MARPSEYTQEKADAICELLAQGKSLRTVCKGDDMPSGATVFKWMRTNEEFLKQYARAKEASADALLEEIYDIADDGRNDFMEDEYMKGKTPGYQLNGENIQRSRLRVDVRKWAASKLKPKKYGDMLDVKSDGKAIQGNTIILKSFKDEDR